METKRKCNPTSQVRVTIEAMERFLNLPEDVIISNVSFDPTRKMVSLILEGERTSSQIPDILFERAEGQEIMDVSVGGKLIVSDGIKYFGLEVQGSEK